MIGKLLWKMMGGDAMTEKAYRAGVTDGRREYEHERRYYTGRAEAAEKALAHFQEQVAKNMALRPPAPMVVKDDADLLPDR